MKRFQRRRLLKLAAFLHDMPCAKFDFKLIFSQGSKPPLEALAAGNHRCGTVGCAIGWMPAALPRVARWQYYGDTTDVVADIVLRADPGKSDFRAAQHAFGISYDESCWLFSPYGGGGYFGNHNTHNVGGDATPKQVAAHIRAFVAQYPKVGELRAELKP